MKKYLYLTILIIIYFRGYSQDDNILEIKDSLNNKKNDFQNAIGLTFYNDNLINNIPFPAINYTYNLKIINLAKDLSFAGRTKVAITFYYPSVEFYPFTLGLRYGYGSGTESKNKIGFYNNIGFGYYMNFGYYISYLGLEYEIGIRYKKLELGFCYIDDLDFKDKQHFTFNLSYIFLTNN